MVEYSSVTPYLTSLCFFFCSESKDSFKFFKVWRKSIQTLKQSCLFTLCTKNPHFAWNWQLRFDQKTKKKEWTRHLPSKAFWSHRAEILALGTNSVKILRVNECRFCTFGDIVASRRCDTLTKNELLCPKNGGLKSQWNYLSSNK